MEDKNILIILVAILFVFIAVLFGLVIFLVLRLSKQSPEVKESNDLSKIKELLELKKQQNAQQEESEYYCQNHPQDHAVGTCAICTGNFCDECLKEHDGLVFCQHHFREYLEHEWVEVETIKTTPDTPETALHIYEFKKVIWDDEGHSAIVSTHYKINIENDFIESYVKLLVKKDESEDLEKKLKTFKLSEQV
tara:strand:+ start:50077 stop:50655 length:579 start_codon:yes stop_codon:yes gene_type:complete